MYIYRCQTLAKNNRINALNLTSGISASDKVNGTYDSVVKFSKARVTIPERLQLFLGSFSVTEFVIHIIRDQLQVKDIITSVITTFLSKWIDFDDDWTENIKGATSMTDDVTLANGLSVTGTTCITGDVTLAKDLSVDGSAQFNKDVNFADAAVFDGRAGFSNEVNFDEEVTVQKDIKVDGKAVLQDNVQVKGDLFTKGSLRVRGGIIETDNDNDVDPQ